MPYFSRFTPSMRYTSRKGAGDVVCSFGNLENVEWKHSDEYSVSVASFSKSTIVKNNYYFMNEKLRDLASILNDMIQDAAQTFKDKYEIEDWGQIQLPSVVRLHFKFCYFFLIFSDLLIVTSKRCMEKANKERS